MPLNNSLLKSPRTLLILLAAAAMVVAAFLVVLSQLGSGGAGSAPKEDVGKLYSGVSQDGTTLGKSDAPVTVYLYEDFQCPFCGQFSRDTFPELVNRDVREGKVRVVSEPLAFLGPDSVEAARAALAAGEQNRYWPYYSLLFDNQGEENSGYITADFLKGLAQKTPGLNVSEWEAQHTKNSFGSELQAVQSRARSAGVDSTPTLIVSGPSGEKKLVGVHDYGQISEAIDQVDGS
jgi:protein-disulfide isomerase